VKYAMLICGDDRQWAALSPADEQDVMKQVYAWFERWQPTGKVTEGGIELQPRDTAKTVRAGANGELFIATSAGILLLLGPVALAPVAALLVGIAAGAESDMVAYLVSYYIGLRSYATVFAVGSATFAIGVTLGAAVDVGQGRRGRPGSEAGHRPLRRPPARLTSPFWTTYDPEVVRAALKRLDAAQTP